MAEEIRELGLALSGLATHDPRVPGTLPGDVARFVDLPDRVANAAALSALDTTTFLAGKTRIAEVHSLAAFFYFDSTSSATADGTTVIAPSVGSGRWLIWPNGGSTIPRVADVAALTALPTSGYPTTSAHLAEVISTQSLWRFIPVTTLGAFSNVTAYVVGNKVSYLGSIYVAIASTTGNLPTNAAFWTLYIGGVSGISVISNDLLGVWCRLDLSDVANLATLAQLPGATMPTGTSHRCFVATVGAWFRYAFGGTSTADGITVVSSLDGLGQWMRMDVSNQAFLQATFWSVSPATGSDENAGWGMSEAAADAHPLQTLQELNRRLFGWHQSNSCAGLTDVSLSIHLMDDLIDPTKFTLLTNLASPDSNDFVRIRGGTTPVDGSASNRTITARTLAAPATNVEREIVIAGIGLKPGYVGKMIQTTDGQKTAFITRQNSADHFSISQVINNASGIDGSDTWSVDDFAVNDHVNILGLTRILWWPFPASGLSYPYAAQLHFDGNVAGNFTQSIIGSGFATAAQCIFGSGSIGAVEFNFLLSEAANLSLDGCLLWGSEENVFFGGTIIWASVAALPAASIFVGRASLIFVDEVLFVGLPGSGAGLRTTGDAPLTIEVTSVSWIGEFGMIGPTIVLVSTHAGVPGEIVGADSNDGFRSLWYGSGNSDVSLIIGKGARCKFPRIGITVVTTGPGFVNLAGRGEGDPSNNYPASDIPIVDLSTLTMLNDSVPTSF